MGTTVPTYEALRLRVRSLESRDTVAAKYGQTRAAAMYDGVGWTDRPPRPFQMVYDDPAR